MILGVRICNFDVFDDDKCGILIEDSVALAKGEINEDQAIRFKNLNALIGRNQTGKTSFLMAMSFIKRSILTDVAKASELDGRPGFSKLLIDKNIPAEFDIFFRIKDKTSGKTKFLQYELVLEANEYGSPVVKSEKVLVSLRGENDIVVKTILDLKYGEGTILDNDSYRDTSITNEHQTALSVYGQIGDYVDISDLYHEIYRWFFCSFSNGEMATYYMEGNAPGGHKHLNSTGSNVQNVLTYMEQSDRVNYENTITRILNKIPAMQHKRSLPAILEESPDKLFMYLLLFSDKDPHSTIFIETPDKDLYHDMVDVLADEMRDFSIRNAYSQIIFSTHNPYIVENMAPKEIWVFTRDFANEENNNVEIKSAGSDPVVNALFKEGVGMGAIWYGGHLDGTRETEAIDE